MNGIYQFLIITVLTFAISFIMGMSVVNVVSQKMSDISINIPKQPPAKIIFEGPQPFSTGKQLAETQLVHQKGGGTIPTENTKEIKKTERIREFKAKDRYYIDPEQMDKEQLDRFVQHADFRRMTVKDYTAWLTTQKANPSKLDGQHKNNLIKLLSGETLSLGDLPGNMFNQPQLNRSPWNSLTDVEPAAAVLRRSPKRYLRKVQLFNSQMQRDLLNKMRPQILNQPDHFANI